MKYISYWYERDQLDLVPSDGVFAADVPEDLVLELEAARARVKQIENQIHEMTQRPRLAEEMRRARLTPKQRREEDFAKLGVSARA